LKQLKDRGMILQVGSNAVACKRTLRVDSRHREYIIVVARGGTAEYRFTKITAEVKTR